MQADPLTPMMKQYLEIKRQYPDTILFYRMGDFYEMFLEDAVLASGILDIALTSRNKNDENPVPMCGVPYRSAQSYIARLIEKGHKVAVCEQTEDPAQAKGLVKREVVRIITPGMVVEEGLLDQSIHNFIAALWFEKQVAGVSILDLSTATFQVTESADLDAILEEIQRIAPRELLLSEKNRGQGVWKVLEERIPDLLISPISEDRFSFSDARDLLCRHFQTLSLEGFGCGHLHAGIAAAGALFGYVEQTQKQSLNHITRIVPYDLSGFLILDEATCRNLELLKNLHYNGRQGTLLDVLDQTVSAMGARLMRQWIRYPLRDRKAICERLDAVSEAVAQPSLRKSVREQLKQIGDLERIAARIALDRCSPRDFLSLKASILALPESVRLLREFSSPLLDVAAIDGSLGALLDMAGLIDRAIREDAPPALQEGGVIKAGYDPELDELIDMHLHTRDYLMELEAREKQGTSINSLKVRYNKVFGYYIEIPKSQIQAVPAHYVRKQTLVNAERYITDELKQFELKISGAQERRIAIETRLFQELRETVGAHIREIQQASAFLARLDSLFALAEAADRYAYCKPEIGDVGEIHIDEGRHPVIERFLPEGRFVPNSLVLDNTANQVLIITGPNMAGKSTILRQTALQVIMVHIGSWVPARHAVICLTDRIFTRIGALDNIASGQSTFLVEMQETANILNNATPKSLVILDEIGRGTSTYDGFSIAWAVAGYLHDLRDAGVKTLFATHYHEMTELERFKPRVKNFSIAVREKKETIVFLHKLLKGGTSRSYGIQVAKLAGIPETVIQHARSVLRDIEEGTHCFSGPAKPVKTAGKPVSEQIPFFESVEHPAIGKLKALDVMNMTPLEALNCLHELFMLVSETSL
ncbi:DNA mismatch repair protein MutS [Desulfatirhabdium butyrativorans]|uniref:DNA mismatch repair protein MutS n=1 Tax=Desulfatirhabdium butyrativorans TaxID=340467 RepID=UPI0004104343|nr:DNA mismatch repair protein MutS [Desulfatirhabdium butyrativorans]